MLDDCTRMLVACHAAPGRDRRRRRSPPSPRRSTTTARPALVLSDNGTAFTSRLTQPGRAIASFARAVHGFGTRLIHSSPYHPQTCGKVERHHQTLKKWLRHPTRHAANLRSCRRLLDTTARYYNTRRATAPYPPGHPAPGLDQRRQPRRTRQPPIQTDATVHRCTSTAPAPSPSASHRISVGCAYGGATLTADPRRRPRHHLQPRRPTHSATPTSTPTKSYVPLTRTGMIKQQVTHVSGLPLDTCLGDTTVVIAAHPYQGRRERLVVRQRGKVRRGGATVRGGAAGPLRRDRAPGAAGAGGRGRAAVAPGHGPGPSSAGVVASLAVATSATVTPTAATASANSGVGREATSTRARRTAPSRVDAASRTTTSQPALCNRSTIFRGRLTFIVIR